MNPLVAAVVIASFVMGNEAYGAQAVGAKKASPSPKPLIMLDMVGHAPIVVERRDSFKKLKENELQRVACKCHINALLKSACPSDTYKCLLEQDGALILKSSALGLAYKKEARFESPKCGMGSQEVEKRKEGCQRCLTEARVIFADTEDTINGCRRKNTAVPDQERKNLSKLFAQVHAVRMQVPKYWKFHNVVSEQNITPYHLEAFKHYMIFEAEYNELQKKILELF
jgi:hypothetical protein